MAGRGLNERSLSLKDEVAELLEVMTLEEKIREMSMYSLRDLVVNGRFDREKADELFKGVGIGCMEDPRQNPEATAEICNDLQDYLKNNTRLGIPAIITCECLHGFMSPDATVFPQSIGLASTWNPELVGEVAGIIAKEAACSGMVQALSPNLDIVRDPRWGRTEETYGEDPYLCGIMGSQYIMGLQGNVNAIDKYHLAATAKHFAAHGIPEGGVNLSPCHIGERELRSVFLQPFRMAVEAGVLAIMPAYSEIDGIPCHASKFLLHRILREELKFDGYVFSDYEGIRMLQEFHHTAISEEEASRQTLEAGVNLEAPRPYAFTEKLVAMVKRGQLEEGLINRAAAAILKVKQRVGLLERYPVDVKKTTMIVNCDENRKLALKAAHESIVLLKNDFKILPLDSKTKTIAVIGPNADSIQLGGYSLYRPDAVTLLQGIRDRAPSGTSVLYAKGCGIYEPEKAGFLEAVNAAKAADVSVVAVGECSIMQKGYGCGENTEDVAVSGESYDRSELDLPGIQAELVKAVMETGTPTVIVLINGRPLSIIDLAENAYAILEAWYPGEQGGFALAEILFGHVCPSGRLPVSFPKSVGQIPVYYNHQPSARGYYKNPGTPLKPGRDYVFCDTRPLYEFGYGLSYTSFEYKNLEIVTETCSEETVARVHLIVKNTGSRQGMETVQMYIRDVAGSVATPVKVLRRFQKIELLPGEQKEIDFDIKLEDLSLLDRDMKMVLEQGEFEIMVGASSEDIRLKGILNIREGRKI